MGKGKAAYDCLPVAVTVEDDFDERDHDVRVPAKEDEDKALEISDSFAAAAAGSTATGSMDTVAGSSTN